VTIRIFNTLLSLLGFALASAAGAMAAPACAPSQGVALQVLGSGGPIADDGRASSGYLVWVDGRARVLIDAGGGTFLRFGEAGASFTDLDFIGLSHFHTDHSADFSALLKSGVFAGRKRPLPVTGPGGAGDFPGLQSWLEAMLGRDGGAYGYLAGYLDGKGATAVLKPTEVNSSDPVAVVASDGLGVHALRVPHGIVPALAYRVAIDDDVLVFASDQNGSDPAFIDFARGASALVMHMVVPEGVTGVGRRLHAPPSVIGDIAAAAQPGTLVLGHFMARSLRNLDANVAEVRKRYNGNIVLADDLVCVVL
jgi:ribonuclease BN (tRNA processing enzyme)